MPPTRTPAMLRFFVGRRRPPVVMARRWLSVQPPVDSSARHHQPAFKDPSSPPLPVLQNPPVSPLPSLSTVSSSQPRGFPLYSVVGALFSAAGLAAYFATPPSDRHIPRREQIYAELEQTLEKSKGSVRRVTDQMRQTGAAAAVLWKSLASMMSSANHEVRSGFEHRVAAFIADVSAVSGARREAIVGAGSGAVVDWLLKSVASSGNGSGDHNGTQAESARALAYLIADHNVCPAVLGRPHAVPSLLKFIFSFQPKKSKKHSKHSSSDSPDLCKGRSILVAALMDIITSNCDNIDQASFQPMLPQNADMRDIATAIEVIEQGGMHFNDHNDVEDNDDGDAGIRGIGIKVLGGATVLGFSSTKNLLKLSQSDYYQVEKATNECSGPTFQDNIGISPGFENLAFAAVPGLWDDLQREHVAVPFAAWALAHWALASELNRLHIQELDSDGQAIKAALKAPERTVKWNGSLVARALLSDLNLPLTISVPEWSSSLLSTAYHASNNDDISLARVALSAFLVSIERSDDAKTLTMKEGLYRMRGIAKQSEKHKHLQESLAKALGLLYRTGMHLSLEESQRWSGILLRWVFEQSSSLVTRLSATKILSSMIEDYGPYTVPISQGWLTLLLDEIIKASRTTDKKGNAPPKTDKQKSLIDQSNVQSATQVANQLAASVIRLEGEFEKELASSEQSPLLDFLSLEPFAAVDKNMKKNNLPKFDSADSAFATLKGIKALTELCSGDITCQNKIVDSGVLCLLRRFLLGDDYEKLAANEAYAASRVLEAQGHTSTDSGGSGLDPKDISSVRVPPTAHIRRHAARILNILSLLPNVKRAISDDEIWCKWLENCACGKIPCCDDPKIQSYARATLLNIFCLDKADFQTLNGNSMEMDGANHKTKCPQYEDMLFLLNPQLPHWKVYDKKEDRTHDVAVARPDASIELIPSHVNENEDSETSCSLNGRNDDKSTDPLVDVVFIHGLRGGPFKSWRIADDKYSTTRKGGLIEDIDQDAGKQGTCWPSEWLSTDFPEARLFAVKYKTNLTQWSGATLPLQEVSALLLKKLTSATIGERPVVFVTHSMGGLVVKQMLYQAKLLGLDEFVKNTVGVVFYSCPHFGSKLADMPWRMGLVLRPAPTIGELRSGSPRLIELNDLIRRLHKKGLLEVLSFSETQVTPIVEGYGGWALRAEVVAIESAYPGFGELVVLEDTDHINSCKPLNRTDVSYSKTLEFLKKLRSHLT